MGLRIATNVTSMSAQRNLGINSESQKGSLEKLGSGSRINRAADDAAGLAIAEKMRAAVRSIGQDVRNANDGISMIQTAEGGMNEISNILVRFRELSIQAASDTVTEKEREFMDKEVQQLHKEVDRIARATNFNGIKLLDGGTGSLLDIHVGQGADEVLDRFQFKTGEVASTTESLKIGGLNVLTKESAQTNLDQIDGALRTLNGNRAELGSLQNRLQSSIASLQTYNENLSTARSRIKDVDMASETSELTKNNILTQANLSVLSQANQNSTMALKLLG